MDKELIVYETFYLFFTLGEKVFREEVMGCKDELGEYHIKAKNKSAYDFFKFTPPTEDTFDIIPFEPLQLVRYYPMYSHNDSFDNYITLMKKTKEDEIEYYQNKIENLCGDLEKDFICENV